MIAFTQQDAVHTARHPVDATDAPDDTPLEGLCTRFALLCITLFGLQSDAIGDTPARALDVRVNAWLCALYALLIEAPMRRVLGRPFGRDRAARRDVCRVSPESGGAPPQRVGRAPPM